MRKGRLPTRLAKLEAQAAALAQRHPAQAEPDLAAFFLAAVLPEQRLAVEARLREFPARGHGLLAWVTNVAQGERLPERIPPAVIDVYLGDEEALPLHDCEDCGLMVPLRPGQTWGTAATPPQVYFEACPACGGRIGWYAYRNKHGKEPVSGPAVAG
jgi:hypothetical protein